MKFTEDELNNLEWWRGFLSFLVFIAHVAQIIWFPLYGNNSLFAITMSGLANIAVVFFFVISGVLIIFSAQKLTLNGVFDWKKFLINRITRIFPSYYAVLGLSLVFVFSHFFINGNSFQIQNIGLDYIARENISVSIYDFFKGILLINNSGITNLNGPLWSLFIEWWLYMSAMFLFLIFSKGFNWFSKLLFLLLFCFSLFISTIGFGKIAIPYIVIWYFGGVYTLFLYNRRKLFFLLIALSLILQVFLIKVYGLGVVSVRSGLGLGYSIFQMLVSVIFIYLSFNFSGKHIFKRIAPFSYTLYILHFPLTMFCFAIFIKYFMITNLSAIIFTILVIFFNLILANKIATIFEDKVKFRKFVDKFIFLKVKHY